MGRGGGQTNGMLPPPKIIEGGGAGPLLLPLPTSMSLLKLTE